MKKCRDIHWAVAWLALACWIGVVWAESEGHVTELEGDSHEKSNDSHHGNATEHEHGSEHEENLRYHVATVDFGRVMTPYVITAWIILACIAKIRESIALFPRLIDVILS